MASDGAKCTKIGLKLDKVDKSRRLANDRYPSV